MRNLQEQFVESIYNVSVIFTVIMLLSLTNGKQTVSHRTILANMAVAVLFVLIRRILFFEKAITKKQYYLRLMLSFIGGFAMYLAVASIIGINDMAKWTTATWSLYIFLYTAASAAIWFISTFKHKSDVDKLNAKLNKLRQ